MKSMLHGISFTLDMTMEKKRFMPLLREVNLIFKSKQSLVLCITKSQQHLLSKLVLLESSIILLTVTIMELISVMAPALS